MTSSSSDRERRPEPPPTTARTPGRALGAAVLALVLLVPGAGCGERGFQAAMGIVELTATAVELAALVTEASHAAEPVVHEHSDTCGHPWAVIDGVTVFAVDGHWEYRDLESGEWLALPPPEDQAAPADGPPPPGAGDAIGSNE